MTTNCLKLTKCLITAVLLAGFLNAGADDKHEHGQKKAKLSSLAKCVVADEKFEGSDMKPHEVVYEGQTIKLCCKPSLMDFNREPAKALKKMEEEAKKQNK